MKYTDRLPSHPADEPNPGTHDGHPGGHSWMMLCCIPMAVIAVVLVATGIVGAGFLLTVALCMGMMAVMMRGMNHNGTGK